MIVFAAPICANGVDRGNNWILAKTADGVNNVLKVKAAQDSAISTNLTVFTTDGRVYRFDVYFDAITKDDFRTLPI
ncbi:DUF4138 domain-containing protein [Chitinophaga sedimenti]|uniref:DUF4138 domain-containing protein n=1 Tax=Chitinophaga sedimenti TaxID=2033606 RepID=UPI0027E0B2B9|nr:DUF4138 domain-containing protein [Chitinophaga sedimenti]